MHIYILFWLSLVAVSVVVSRIVRREAQRYARQAYHHAPLTEVVVHQCW